MPAGQCRRAIQSLQQSPFLTWRRSATSFPAGATVAHSGCCIPLLLGSGQSELEAELAQLSQGTPQPVETWEH